jgi:hypothetical protein
VKGKQGVASARRREHEAKSKAELLTQQAKNEREGFIAQINELRAEVRRLHAEHTREAGQIAAAEVERILAAKEKERADRGLSDSIAIGMMYEKDKLIRNACRYLSMTKGLDPLDALPVVLAWQTDKQVWRVPSATTLAGRLGVAKDGWVVAQSKRLSQYWERAIKRGFKDKGRPEAYSLDYVDAHLDEFKDRIHERYNPAWYPPISYGTSWMPDLDEDLPAIHDAP